MDISSNLVSSEEHMTCGMENKILAFTKFLLSLENSSHCSLLSLLKLTDKTDVIFITMLGRVGFINTFTEESEIDLEKYESFVLQKCA